MVVEVVIEVVEVEVTEVDVSEVEAVEVRLLLTRLSGAGDTGAGGAAVTTGAGGTGGTAATGPGGARTSGAGAMRTVAGAGDCAAGDTGAGGAGVIDGAGGTRRAAAAGPGDARTRGTGAAAIGGVGGAEAGDCTEPGAARAGGAGAVGGGAGGTGVGGAGARGAGAGGSRAGGAGGTVRPRPYFIPLLQQVLGVLSSTGLTPPLLCPPPYQSQPPLQPASPLPAPSPYTEQTGGLTERREPAPRPASPVCTGRHVPCLRPPPAPGTHAMALRPSSVTLLPLSLVSSPLFSQTLRLSPLLRLLIAGLVDIAAACRLDYAIALVAESEFASPPSIGGECALGTDVLEDRREVFDCLAAAVPRFASMLLAPEGDPNAPDIQTPRSYAEAITGPYSSQLQAAMDAEMASWKSTGT
ncbi:unnamed protein product [Closterium sp. NIES-54]